MQNKGVQTRCAHGFAEKPHTLTAVTFPNPLFCYPTCSAKCENKLQLLRTETMCDYLYWEAPRKLLGTVK